MRLNPDCIRLVLLYLEENLTMNSNGITNSISYSDISLEDFSKEEIIYTLIKLDEADFINIYISYANNALYALLVNSITYDGHMFLENIRNNSIWDKTKEKAKAIGSLSIPILQTISSNILLNSIKN